MNTLVLLAAGIGIFAAGFTLGLIFGLTTQQRKFTREVPVQLAEIKRWLDKWQMSVVGVFLIAAAVLMYQDQQQHGEDTAKIAAAAAQAKSSAAQVKQLGECVAAYDNRLSASLQPVRRASKRNGAADIAFKRAVADLFIPGHNKRDIARVKQTLRHNLAVYDSLTRQRARNPYPSPPKKVCASDSTTP